MGAFGEVRKAYHYKTKEYWAIKIIYKYQIQNTKQINREIKILENLDHPNIVKIYEYFEDKWFYYLVMEFLEGGELFEFI